MNLELKAARESAGLTQKQVAELVTVSERAYQEYEYAKKEPSVRTAIRIARTLNSTVEDLFGAATPTDKD